MLEKLKRWAKSIKRDVHALYLDARDPSTPLLAKVVAMMVAAYAIDGRSRAIPSRQPRGCCHIHRPVAGGVVHDFVCGKKFLLPLTFPSWEALHRVSKGDFP